MRSRFQMFQRLGQTNYHAVLRPLQFLQFRATTGLQVLVRAPHLEAALFQSSQQK